MKYYLDINEGIRTANQQRWDQGPEAAIEVLSATLKTAPSRGKARAHVLWQRGKFWRALGELDAAIEDCTHAIEALQPDTPATGKAQDDKSDLSTEAWLWRGSFYAAKGDFSRALADYNAFVRHGGSEHTHGIRDRQLHYDDLMLAMDDVNAVIAAHPKQGVPYFSRAIIKYALYDVSGALEDWNAAYIYSTDDEAELHQTCMTYLKQKPRFREEVTEVEFARMKPDREYCRASSERPCPYTITLYGLRHRRRGPEYPDLKICRAELTREGWHEISSESMREWHVVYFERPVQKP
ncbi:MAG: hypothetical protein GYB65_00080 [Chloroflexi bacterium]|nr:hypothetical protein [Chloroflexota bacterium]